MYQVTAYADGIVEMFKKLGADENARRELAGLVMAADAAHVAAYGHGIEWMVEKHANGDWSVYGRFNATDINFIRRA